MIPLTEIHKPQLPWVEEKVMSSVEKNAISNQEWNQNNVQEWNQNNVAILKVPKQVHQAIFSFLSFKDIVSLGETCKQFNKFTQANEIWEPYYNICVLCQGKSLAVTMGLKNEKRAIGQYVRYFQDEDFFDVDFSKPSDFLGRIKKIIPIMKEESSDPRKNNTDTQKLFFTTSIQSLQGNMDKCDYLQGNMDKCDYLLSRSDYPILIQQQGATFKKALDFIKQGSGNSKRTSNEISTNLLKHTYGVLLSYFNAREAFSQPLMECQRRWADIKELDNIIPDTMNELQDLSHVIMAIDIETATFVRLLKQPPKNGCVMF